MSDMEVSIRFRWKAGVDSVVNAISQILVNDVFNKILETVLVIHLFPS